LSYEYAASSLATVTATTRQSADVVGTAFKTLFARIQDLELGKTLDDGVTLGKYSEGLAAVGVNILDTNGNLKDMNVILDDMGSKWDTLSKAQ
jgi:TP901 family phage tail tape measure protein